MSRVSQAQQYNSHSFSLKVGDDGRIGSLKSLTNGHEYGSIDSPGVLLQLVEKGKVLRPVRAAFDKENIELFFADGKVAQIKAAVNSLYITFRLISVSNGISAIKWGPFNTFINDTIGNTVGVVRSRAFAIGIQGLNKKTSGGELVNEEGAVFERGTTATEKRFGSSLQAFTINRSYDREITVWGRWPDVPVKKIEDGGLNGSSIAIFGCVPSQVLSIIESITQREGLPYPKLKNRWIKQSPETGKPYMITSFSESNIDTLLSYAKKMGMAAVYHEDPFETWGHFVLKKSLFPNGRAGFKACVEKAHSMGLRLGFHTLTNFITTNDAYVTPTPSPDLAQAGSDELSADVSANASEIPVMSDKYFKLKSDLNSVLIGNEIIRFTSITEMPPFRLIGCVRGAFGTRKQTYKAGTTISRLIDHPYKVFFPDWKLQKKVAENLAAFINETGADQMDFDGHEGTYATGMGDLSFNTFAEDVFKKADHAVVFGSSRDNHYFWHINSYLNWGEPWYGGFRESQSELRITNQKFYEDNYMPNMLGWFLITAQTSPDDIDWMLARAAGYNAGYALVLRPEALTNPHMQNIVSRIKLWTSVQQAGLFNIAQKLWLKNPDNDAELQQRGTLLYFQMFKKVELAYEAKVLQPGQPTSESWQFDNEDIKQVPTLIIHAEGEDGQITNPIIDIDHTFHLLIQTAIQAGQTLILNDANGASLYDSKGKIIKRIPIIANLPELTKTTHTLTFDGTTDVNSPVKVRIELKLLKNEELLTNSMVNN